MNKIHKHILTKKNKSNLINGFVLQKHIHSFRRHVPNYYNFYPLIFVKHFKPYKKNIRKIFNWMALLPVKFCLRRYLHEKNCSIVVLKMSFWFVRLHYYFVCILIDFIMTFSFQKIFGSSHKTSFSGDSPDPLQCIYWSIAYTIQTFERQIRSEKTSLGELIDTRPYQCLRALVALVRSQHSVYSYTVPRKLFLYLSNYLLIQTFYSTSPYNILDLDSFSLLVTLLCTSGSLFVDDDNTHLSKKFAVLLGNSTDKNLIQFILTLHLVQVSCSRCCCCCFN